MNDNRTAAPAPSAPADQPPSRNWWCPYCECEVPPEHVTYEETHDPRHGGCSSKVLAERAAPADQPSPDKQGQQGAMRFEAPEEFCGLQQTVSDRTTNHGTNYEIVHWTCPNCGKACSCINVDGEWCHGDALSISFGPEKDADGTWTRHHKCTACWLAASPAPTEEPRTDGGEDHQLSGNSGPLIDGSASATEEPIAPGDASTSAGEPSQ